MSARRPRPSGRGRCAVLFVLFAFVAAAALAQPPANSPSSLTVYTAGDLADCGGGPPERAPVSLTARLVPQGAWFIGLGDMGYPFFDAATIAGCYAPTWGVHRERTLAVPGNHDYHHGTAADFRRYFSIPAEPSGFVAYARWLTRDWLLVALDSNAGAAAHDAQYRWLQDVLEREWAPAGRDKARAKSRCLVVAWHTPVFSSGLHRGSGDAMRPYWRLLDSFGADVILGGHEHFYEAFEPRDADGRAVADGEGPREFVVGTGGGHLYGFWRPPYASRARVLRHGVLELSLDAGRYAWRFIDVEGLVRDSGTAACRSGH